MYLLAGTANKVGQADDYWIGSRDRKRGTEVPASATVLVTVEKMARCILEASLATEVEEGKGTAITCVFTDDIDK